MGGKTNMQILKSLKREFEKKNQGWKERLLSKASKEILIKAMVQLSLPFL